MGTLSFLTKEQQIIYSEVAQNNYIRKNFYFTGGTALSSFYLHHRYSDDLDFFSETSFDNQVIFTLMQEWGKKHQFSLQSRFVEVVYIFDLVFPKNIPLKIDFSYYPYKRIKKGNVIDKVTIDSLFDIGVNKIVTVSQRSDVKDFVDLYFILQKLSTWDLIHGAKIKFHMEIEPFLLAVDFLKVEDFTFLPRMISSITLDELQSFYRKKAQDLGKKSLK